MQHFLSCIFVSLFVFSAVQAQETTENKSTNQQKASEEKQVDEKKSPYENRPVLSIEFRGNTHISSDQLREKIKYQKAGEIYNKEKLNVDLDTLRIFAYADDGYLQARFGTPEIEDTTAGLKITIPVLEGFRYRIGDIKVEDAKLLSPAEVLQILGLKTGDVARGYNLIQKGIESLIRYYKERGYTQFNVDFSPEFLDGSPATNEAIVDLTFVLEEGAVYTIGKIKFKGNIVVSEALLRSNLTIREGDLYKQSAIDETVNRLYNLRLFDEVGASVDLEKHEKERLVDITIRLKEK